MYFASFYPLTMNAIKMMLAAVLFALFMCTTEAATSWCGMKDNGDPETRLFLTCTCQERACTQAWEMRNDVSPPSIVWNFGLAACNKCVEICDEVAESVRDIHARKSRASGAAHRCVRLRYGICFEVGKFVDRIDNLKHDANKAALRCLLSNFSK